MDDKEHIEALYRHSMHILARSEQLQRQADELASRLRILYKLSDALCARPLPSNEQEAATASPVAPQSMERQKP